MKIWLRKIHLWLGLGTGLLVFIIAVTGCIYAFKDEIQWALQDFRKVEIQTEKELAPSAIRKISDAALPGKHIHAVQYTSPKHAVKAIYYSQEEGYYDIVYINPYSGKVLKVRDEARDFFRIVLWGHFYLFLPADIGQNIVGIVTLGFLVLVISGLFLWMPKKRNQVSDRLKVKWGASWRRVNFDVHQVVGLYTLLFSLVFIITGLMWCYEWFRKGSYEVASGHPWKEYYEPASVKNRTDSIAYNANAQVDKIYYWMQQEYGYGAIEVHFPESDTGCIAANFNPDHSTFWQIDYRYFDMYTLKELSVDHLWGRFQPENKADIIFRMNYDIHVGAIAGLPGKIIAFITSLLIASLPVTGFLLWKGRRFKKSS
ncbi:MAG: PepSY-associated TM helix domain-containing protein [Cytophagaceae bacterium]